MSIENQKIFHIEDLNLYYGDVQALKHVNLTIYENEVTALIGPSGCGKSTFLRTLNRMNDLVDSCKIDGNVTFRDENIYKERMDVIHLRKRVGMVFQKPNPFPMTIYDNITYGLNAKVLKIKPNLNGLSKNP